MQGTLSCCNDRQPRTQALRLWASGASCPNSSVTYSADKEDQYLDGESISGNDVTKTLEIKNKAGITLGDIYSATKKLREAHALCPYASEGMYDEHGTVRPETRFHSDKTLKEGDPYVTGTADGEDSQTLRTIKASSDNEVLQTYMRAKRRCESTPGSNEPGHTFKWRLTPMQRGRADSWFQRILTSRRSMGRSSGSRQRASAEQRPLRFSVAVSLLVKSTLIRADSLLLSKVCGAGRRFAMQALSGQQPELNSDRDEVPQSGVGRMEKQESIDCLDQDQIE